MEKQITKIVLTGGPCAGKTSALVHIRKSLTELGYHVITVPETATELISGGITPYNMSSKSDYQNFQMQLQSQKERIFIEAAQIHPAEKIIIIFDRALIDSKAYMSESDFIDRLKKLNLSEAELHDRYDGVFHLVSAACGATEFYTLANNGARAESVEEAAELDKRLINAWKNNKNFYIIDNSTDFENKINRLNDAILNLLEKIDMIC